MVEGKIRVIDRFSNLFKLEQGVFVGEYPLWLGTHLLAPENLETAYSTSRYIDQIYVYGDASMNKVAAVVVPTLLLLSKVNADLGISHSY